MSVENTVRGVFDPWIIVKTVARTTLLRLRFTRCTFYSSLLRFVIIRDFICLMPVCNNYFDF